MKEIALQIEKKIEAMSPLKREEVLFWANEKLHSARKKETVKYFESIIHLLPKAVILSFGLSFRCVIFKITNTTYERVAEGVPERHLKERIFSRDKMPPPIKELVENGGKNIYIEDALTDERTQYMRLLVKNARIKDIYYTKVITSSGIWILVVDGTDKKVSEEKRTFLDMLGFVIQNIQEDLAEIKEAEHNVTKTRIGVTTFLINLLHHKVRNKVEAIRGLCDIIDKTTKNNGTDNGGNCSVCRPKTQKMTEIIKKDFEVMVETLNQLGEILHDIERGKEIKAENIPISELFGALIDIHRDTLIELEDPGEDFVLSIDFRKIVKALCRITDQLIQRNKNFVRMSVSRIVPGKIKILIEQEDINTEKLHKLLNLSECDTIIDHSLEDFKVFISATLLAEMEGILVRTNPHSVEIVFPEII